MIIFNFINMRILLLFCLLTMIINLSYAQTDDKYPINWQLIDYTVDENLPMIKKSIAAGAYINFRNENGATPLMIAVEKSNLEIVKYLLNIKADPNLSTYDSFTPLMMSTFKGNLDITELLILNKADINAKDNYDATALCYAAAFGDFVMSDMLLFYGANPNIKTFDQSSLLHIAAFTNDTNLFMLFLSKGLNINDVNKLNYTPLMIASQNNYSLLADFIIKNGAQISYTDTNGLGALTIAIYNRSPDIINQIITHKEFRYTTNGKLKYNPIIASRITHQKKTEKNLKKLGLKSGKYFVVDELTLQFDLIPNFDDHFFRIASGIHELNSNFYLNFGYQNRLKGKQLFVNKKETKYLLWEHRSGFDLNLIRNFRIGNYESKIYLATGLDFLISYATYDGIKEKPDTKYLLLPEIGIVYCTDYINMGLNYVYTPYNFQDIPNHRIKYSVIFKVPLVKKPSKYYLSWMQ